MTRTVCSVSSVCPFGHPKQELTVLILAEAQSIRAVSFRSFTWAVTAGTEKRKLCLCVLDFGFLWKYILGFLPLAAEMMRQGVWANTQKEGCFCGLGVWLGEGDCSEYPAACCPLEKGTPVCVCCVEGEAKHLWLLLPSAAFLGVGVQTPQQRGALSSLWIFSPSNFPTETPLQGYSALCLMAEIAYLVWKCLLST